MSINQIENKRTCDGCTACCEGWLSGEVYGKKFCPGTPCHFKGESGCSIYEDRPENPCKSFLCEWMENLDLPEWMKPSVSKIIILKEHDKKRNIEYFDVFEMEEKIDSSVLCWLINYSFKSGIPMNIQVGGEMHQFGFDRIKNVKTFDYQ